MPAASVYLDHNATSPLRPQAFDAMKASISGLGSLFLAGDKPAIRKALLRLRYLDKFAEEARARRMNLERSSA